MAKQAQLERAELIDSLLPKEEEIALMHIGHVKGELQEYDLDETTRKNIKHMTDEELRYELERWRIMGVVKEQENSEWLNDQDILSMNVEELRREVTNQVNNRPRDLNGLRCSITVSMAEGLNDPWGKGIDPLFKVSHCEGKKGFIGKSPALKKTNSPNWNAKPLRFDVNDDVDCSNIIVEVFHHLKMGDKSIGLCKVDLYENDHINRGDRWYDLAPGAKGVGGGRVRIAIDVKAGSTRPASLNNLHKMFQDFDPDNTGFISLRQFEKLQESHGLFASQSSAREAATLNALTFVQCCDLCSHELKQTRLSQNVLRHMFCRKDPRASGDLDSDAWESLLKDVGGSTPEGLGKDHRFTFQDLVEATPVANVFEHKQIPESVLDAMLEDLIRTHTMHSQWAALLEVELPSLPTGDIADATFDVQVLKSQLMRPTIQQLFDAFRNQPSAATGYLTAQHFYSMSEQLSKPVHRCRDEQKLKAADVLTFAEACDYYRCPRPQLPVSINTVARQFMMATANKNGAAADVLVAGEWKALLTKVGEVSGAELATKKAELTFEDLVNLLQLLPMQADRMRPTAALLVDEQLEVLGVGSGATSVAATDIELLCRFFETPHPRKDREAVSGDMYIEDLKHHFAPPSLSDLMLEFSRQLKSVSDVGRISVDGVRQIAEDLARPVFVHDESPKQKKANAKATVLFSTVVDLFGQRPVERCVSINIVAYEFAVKDDPGSAGATGRTGLITKHAARELCEACDIDLTDDGYAGLADDLDFDAVMALVPYALPGSRKVIPEDVGLRIVKSMKVTQLWDFLEIEPLKRDYVPEGIEVEDHVLDPVNMEDLLISFLKHDADNTGTILRSQAIEIAVEHHYTLHPFVVDDIAVSLDEDLTFASVAREVFPYLIPRLPQSLSIIQAEFLRFDIYDTPERHAVDVGGLKAMCVRCGLPPVEDLEIESGDLSIDEVIDILSDFELADIPFNVVASLYRESQTDDGFVDAAELGRILQKLEVNGGAVKLPDRATLSFRVLCDACYPKGISPDHVCHKVDNIDQALGLFYSCSVSNDTQVIDVEDALCLAGLSPSDAEIAKMRKRCEATGGGAPFELFCELLVRFEQEPGIAPKMFDLGSSVLGCGPDDFPPLTKIKELIVAEGACTEEEIDTVFGKIGASELTQRQIIKVLAT